ncbi:MAG: efflux RND transporter periplasmic adaptor subunit [Novosphingobium sp.]|jgi:cobalt-zinc-cadmium efflux system membrane fusion protein
MGKNKALFGGAALLTTVAAGWWGLTPSAADKTSETQAAASAGNPDLVLADPSRIATLGIELAAATSAGEVPLADIPATIAPPPNSRVAVAATLPGTVQRTFVNEGDLVRAGQPLAVIVSRDVLTLGADLSRANARLGVSQASAARLSRLSKEGIIAEARADEARAVAAEARADVAEKSRILRLVGGSGSSGTYTLSAPISGRVSHADISAGNPVDGATAPFVIDAEGRYEVTGQLPERLVGVVLPGMNIRLGNQTGRITSVGTTIDPASRSAMLKATLPPAPGVLAGRNASVTVLGPAPAGAVSVPAGAIASIDGKDYVFVAAKGGFLRRKVKAGPVSAEKAVIFEGLKNGERVVVKGTSALKAMVVSG